MSSIVRPEFGPTLPELAGARWPRLRLALLVLAGVAAVAVLVLRVTGAGAGQTAVVVRAPVAFNLVYDGRLQRVAPPPGAELRLRTPAAVAAAQQFEVRPWTLPPYAGTDPGGAIPVYASGVIDRMAREIPGFVLRSEGRTRVNLNPGYVIVYQGTEAGRTLYGKRYLLYPDVPSPRTGAELDLRARRSGAVPSADAVGDNGPLKLPLRSFRFGTERP